MKVPVNFYKRIESHLLKSTDLKKDEVALLLRILSFTHESYISHIPILEKKIKKLHVEIPSLILDENYSEIIDFIRIFNSLENKDVNYFSPPISLKHEDIKVLDALMATETLWKSNNNISIPLPQINFISRLLLKKGITDNMNHLLKGDKEYKNNFMEFFGMYFNINRNDWAISINDAVCFRNNKRIIYHTSTPGILHPKEYDLENKNFESKQIINITKNVWKQILIKNIDLIYYWNYDGVKKYIKENILPDYINNMYFDEERLKNDIRKQISPYLNAKNIQIILLKFLPKIYSSEHGGIACVYDDSFDFTFRSNNRTKCAVRFSQRSSGSRFWNNSNSVISAAISEFSDSTILSSLIKKLNPISYIYNQNRMGVDEFNKKIVSRVSEGYFILKPNGYSVEFDYFYDQLFERLNIELPK